MNAKTLFQEGIVAIRDDKDLTKGRELLMQSLRLEPQNEMAWLWLSRTVNDPNKKVQCLERALKINPANTQARALMEKLSGAASGVAVTAAPVVAVADEEAEPTPPPKKAAGTAKKASLSNQQRIDGFLARAKELLADDDPEGAIEQWVRVLEIEVDHEEAISNAVRHLSRLKYIDDAHELVSNAINANTNHPSIYLTAIDIAKYQGKHDEADGLRVRLAKLPEAGDTMTSEIVDYFVHREQIPPALDILEYMVQEHPKSQKLLLRLADLYKENGRKTDAVQLYEQAARLSARTKEGKEADERLLTFAPTLTDKERASVPLAVREAAGFGVVYLLMAWQDAGLDLLQLGFGRLIGVVLSVLGGYLVITATSSPQQQPLAKLLGGEVPPPPEKPKSDFEAHTSEPEEVTEIPIIPAGLRIGLGLAGAVVLIVAFAMVFSTAVGLLGNPRPPVVPTFEEIFGTF